MAAACLLFSCVIQAQTLFSYGPYKVSKAEFLRAYNKNNSTGNGTPKAYRDYLDLYTRFKLKVQSAYDAHLDTAAVQGTELKNFRAQVIESFMSDESSVQQLVTEAFERSRKDLRIANIYIPFGGGDTAAAYRRATDAYNLIRSGTDFGKVAEQFSADPAARTTQGDIGWITVFTLPYEFENIVYSTPVGKAAMPFRSKTAYHIFKTLADRPAVGRMKAAQILLAFPPNPDEAEKAKKKALADSIYTALQNGADFGDLAARYSNDNISYQAGGLLPEFGTGRYNEVFENAAFGLVKDGEISKPLLTEFGYHIIKRIERVPVNTDTSNKEAMAALRQTVQADKRILVAKQLLAQKIMTRLGYTASPFDQPAFARYADSVYANKHPGQLALMNDGTVLFSFSGQKVTAADFGRYIHTVQHTPEMLQGRSTRQLLQQYAEMVALEYYRNHLEQYNSEFGSQMKEFKDGNLLFDIMQRKVWDRASGDAAGLKQFYTTHKNRYWWAPSADVILFTGTDSADAAKALVSYKGNPGDWKRIWQNSNGTVQADSGRFELNQLPPAVTTGIYAGKVSEPVKNLTDNTYSFAAVIKLFPGTTQRNFDDARGFVINDYQADLENQWIARLKQKYPVKINEQVLESCWK